MSADPRPTPTVPPSSPAPRRWARPRWINLRVVVGLLLVAGSVLVGARVLAADRETTEIWSVGVDLAAGAVVGEGDLQVREVRLGDSAAAYLLADGQSPVGQELNRPVRAGELLPAAAVGLPTEGRVVVLPVQPDRLPAGVVHGSTVDIYLQSGRGTAEVGTTELLRDVTVQTVDTGAGGLGSVSGTVLVSVSLTPEQAQVVVPRLAEGDILLVLVTGR